ncbi:MAG: hypothetical protein JWO84_32 [Parcubacteria group bacterium]|nr:hypothetical protein [Parcubacteria group bacterium]
MQIRTFAHLASNSGKVIRCWLDHQEKWQYGRLAFEPITAGTMGPGYVFYFRSYQSAGSRHISETLLNEGLRCQHIFIRPRDRKKWNIPSLEEIRNKKGEL